MLKARRDAAVKVAESLFAAEEALDVALARAADLNSAIVTARAEAKLSALLGQDAIESAAATFAALIRARCSIVETHKRLDDAKTQIGLRTVSVGDAGPKPPEPSGISVSGHLSVVA